MSAKIGGGKIRGRMLMGSTTEFPTIERSTTIALMVFWFGLISAALLHAQDPSNITVSSPDLIGSSLPTVQRPARGLQGSKAATGFANGMSYRVRFAEEYVAGYVAIEITIQSQTMFAADRNLVFRFRGVDDEVYPPRRNLVVDTPVSISQGTNSQTVTRYLPRWAITREVSIDVLEDNRPIPNLAAEVSLLVEPGTNLNFGRGNNTNFQYTRISLKDEYELNVLKVIEPSRPTKADFNAAASLSIMGNISVDLHPLSKMPTDWRAYQQFDVIVFSSDLLRQLPLHPDAFSSVRQWVMMGGTVVVTGESDHKTVLSNLDFSEGFEKTSTERITEVVADLKVKWTQSEANAENMLASMTGGFPNTINSASPFEVQQLDGKQNNSLDERIESVKSTLALFRQAKSRDPSQWADRIRMHPIAAGMVVRLPSDQPSLISQPDLDVITGLISYRVSPMLRRGVDPMIGDSRFRDWLIPGVAQPPVYTFMGLLTVFVILVGPIAYRQTARHQRSHLMFLIAPVLAIITTTMMFAYGIVSDGFGTSARIRQLTLVDGVSATGVDRIRSTYFAGVRPAEGLRFGGHDEVMAYPESNRIAWGNHSSQTPKVIGAITLNEKEQRFDSSFLPSRTQTQFVVHRPVPNIGSLRVNATDESVTLVNEFDFPLRRLVIRPNAKQYFMVDSIHPGSTSKAIEIEAKDLSKKLGGLYNDFRPILSTSNESRSYQNSGKNSDLLRDVMREVAPRNVAYDGVFESKLRNHLQTRLEIPVGHFVAISDVSDDVVAVAEAEQVGCVRYIMGTFVSQETP
jgi:hypothetical protein